MLIIVVSRSLLPQRLIGCQFTVIPLTQATFVPAPLTDCSQVTANPGCTIEMHDGTSRQCRPSEIAGDTANRHRQPPKESSNRQNVYSLPVVCVCHCKILILFAILCWLPGYSDIGCQERQPTLAANNRPSLSARMSQP